MSNESDEGMIFCCRESEYKSVTHKFQIDFFNQKYTRACAQKPASDLLGTYFLNVFRCDTFFPAIFILK